MSRFFSGFVGAAGLAAIALGGTAAVLPWQGVEADVGTPVAPSATPASVARVEERQVVAWAAFSGRLEAIDHVEVRSRVAGQIDAIHFREGALVAKGAPLVSIDPAPFAAEVDRARAQLAIADARVRLAKSDLERGRKMTALATISQRDLDVRESALREAEAARDGAAAALRTANLDLGYTQVRAPIAGRVGRIEITAGNLVAAGPGAPVLVRLVSIDPIYASFDADEGTVANALASLPAAADRSELLSQIPVEIAGPAAARGQLQYVDPSVDARAGTVRVRGVFENRDGALMPGQFARLRLGRAKAEPALLVSERAIGVDQDKTFVLVVGDDDKAAYREVTLGRSADGLKVVTNGLSAGERVVVNGLQKLKPGDLVAPEPVAMDGRASLRKQASAD